MILKKEQILENDTILKFPHIYAIDASAGAGKTTYLTERFLQFLFSERIQTKFWNLAAITFTNEAANEMKRRIILLLKKIAFGYREECSKLLPLVRTDEISMIQRAEEIIEDILLHYTDLNIGTIDSFINSIIRASAIESGVSPDFEITMQTEALVEYALDIILEELQDSPPLRKDFDKFLNSYLNIEESAGWYPKSKLLEWINFLRKKENEKGISFSSTEIKEIELDKELDNIKKLMEKFLMQCENLKLPLEKNAFGGIRKFIETTKADSAFLQKDNPDELFIKNTIIPEELKRSWIDIRKKLVDYYKKKAIVIFNPYIKIQKTVQKNLDDIKYEKGMIFIDELNARVKNLINDYQVPYIYYKFGEQITHYLIDEFQDTNEIQWENIKNLVQNSLSEGGSLFYVGDKKQAIYRFRGGKSELFDEVLADKELTLITNDVYSKTITENRRSKKVIIDFINSVFTVDNLSKLSTTRGDKIDIRNFMNLLQKNYSNVRQEVPQGLEKEREGGFVSVQSFKKSTSSSLTNEEIDDLIKEKLLNDIRYVLSRRKDTDIAVLVRSNKEVKIITEWLLEEGIETVSETAGDLREHPLILEIISFFKFLKDPLDNLAFVGFICGDIFTTVTQLKRDEIYNWLNNQNHKNVVLYKKFKEWKKVEWDNYIEYYFKNVGFVPVYDLIVNFFDRFKVLLNFKDASGFLIHFLEAIRRLEENGKNHIEQIVQEFETKHNDEIFNVQLTIKSGAVNVMTIHKAKGLEFSCVFVPFAGISLKTNNIIVLHETNEIFYTDKDIRNFCKDIRDAYNLESTKTLIDEINTFYVACTRAKDELYIYVPPKKENYNNLLLNIYPFSHHDIFESGEKVASYSSQAITKKDGIEFFSTPVKSDWVKGFHGLLTREEFIDSVVLKYNPAIKIGNLVHRILSTITTFDENKIKQEIAKLNEIDELKSKIEEMVKKIVSCDLLKRFFYPGKDDRVYCELEVISEEYKTKRIDRMIISDEEATIVDFKTGSSKNLSNDKKQIKEYINLVKKIYPEKKTTGLIVYIEPFNIIEVE